MTRDQTIGLLWAALAVIYGLSVAFTDANRAVVLGGALLFALLAIFTPIIRKNLPPSMGE